MRSTSEVYLNSEEAKALNGRYDCFIVGSDQVWNPENNGNDAAYLLDFVKDNSQKISYSSSFGISTIDDAHKESYRKNLASFKALAIRETIGREIIKNLTGREAQVVLDPVMLLTKGQWLQLVPASTHVESYIFSYTNRDSQLADFFKTGYNLGGKKHYLLSRYTRPADFLSNTVRVKYCMSPQEFVSVIAGAHLVISASFHCLAMAIVLERPFVAILTGNIGKDERLLNLLRATGLENRILTPSLTVEKIDSPIDWSAVSARVDDLKKSSIEYLKHAINNK